MQDDIGVQPHRRIEVAVAGGGEERVDHASLPRPVWIQAVRVDLRDGSRMLTAPTVKTRGPG